MNAQLDSRQRPLNNQPVDTAEGVPVKISLAYSKPANAQGEPELNGRATCENGVCTLNWKPRRPVVAPFEAYLPGAARA